MADELVTEMRGLLGVSGTAITPLTSSKGTDSAQDDEKPVVNTDTNETEEPLFELMISHGKGLGLFATKSIPRGTRIIEEAPLLAVPARKGDALGLSHVVTALGALNHEQHNKVFELHRGRKVALGKELLGRQPKAIGRALSQSDILDAVAIFKANSVAMGEGGGYGSGVFEHYSRINHACNPNVHNSYNPTLNRLTVHAVRQINKGEEILTSYIAGTCRTREQRQPIFRNWDFECGCKCCMGPKAAASDLRRGRMFELDQQLAFYAKGLRGLPGHPVPSTPQAALQVCEDLLELYRSEGITDLSLALIYRECSTYSLKSGQFDKSVNYAKKERDVERYCIGTETAHLAKGMKGAEFWLEHVLGKRQKDTAQRKAAESLLEEKMARKWSQPKKKGCKGKKKWLLIGGAWITITA